MRHQILVGSIRWLTSPITEGSNLLRLCPHLNPHQRLVDKVGLGISWLRGYQPLIDNLQTRHFDLAFAVSNDVFVGA